MRHHAILFRLGITALGLTGLSAPVRAQVQERVYPAAAPTARDTATNDANLRDQQQFANPSVLGMGPSKGLIVRYERMPKFGVTSAAQVQGLSDFSTDVNKNARLSIKGYIPAWNHPHLKVIVGLSYEREEFQFAKLPTNYELYDNIENKGLKSTAAQIAIIRPVDAVHWYLARVKGELSGDYTSSQLTKSDYSRFSAEAIYGWKRSPNFSWGLGFQYGYTFGRLSIYPAVVYNRTFNARWGVEALAPARVTLRYNANQNSIFYAGYTVDGYNYIVNLSRAPLTRRNPDGSPDLSKATLSTLELRETEVKFRLRWERELLSFLWLGAEAGYRYNYAFDAFDRTNADREKIIDSQFNGAPYASLELFITPPRKLLEKAGVRR
ncbi:DUF6268 family outer membrane beta-barrel protein [Hymenobacter sp. DH14]|uniref:DUF6268 family outer membrane beta-barrel protein n=1 Tax=Hymenobacter cyanobacteriorum TaxID=2926463 RepID=A0A9X1VEN7_9BACT|nr:DUF6268 family outer membrane beta-barrel protein [Hymenobacter cyanobacteriorum]MCI1187769.1 DUF6268 family outer membrane beta-barrel protein [Hymenobacter cyanobacteriorum]